MAQQISIEAALEAYRERAAALFHENILLSARISELQAEPRAQVPAGDGQTDGEAGTGS
jgi:hypothetical protein